MPAPINLAALEQFSRALLLRLPFARAIYGKLRNSILADLQQMRQRPAFAEGIAGRIPLLETSVFQTFPSPDFNGDIDIPISIVMSTHNRGHCIGDAIDSVLAQRYRHWELIIVDDGSEDSTAQDVSSYLGDERIRYIVQSHRGHSNARNHGLRLARGALIAYLDSDNVWYPDFLIAAAEAFTRNPSVDFVYGALVSRHHGDETRPVLWYEFDRDELLKHNYIDLNTMVHRSALVGRFGGFDESLDRLTDWDLALRYSAHAPAKRIPVLAARYRVRDNARISDTVPYGPAYFNVRRKWLTPRDGGGLRVLYVVWHYPQLSESYIETEIRGMQRLGVHVEVWRQTTPVSPYPSLVPVHDGSISDAIKAARPDILHVHWLGFGLSQEAWLRDAGIPVTFRLHGFEVTSATLSELLKRSWVSAIYAFPHQLQLVDAADARIRAINSQFDSVLFKPNENKDRRLVVRTAAALASKDLPFLFDLAEQLPDFRFVLAGVTCNEREAYVTELKELHRQKSSRVDLRFDVPREEVAALVGSAGIYLHTAVRPGQNGATPLGMPISIAEAMATGAYLVVPDLPELTSYAGNAGIGYRDLAGAAKAIADTAGWSDDQWFRAWRGSVDRAFLHHADEAVLLDILEDWHRIAGFVGSRAGTTIG